MTDCPECEASALRFGADAKQVHLIRCAEDCAHFLTSTVHIYDQANKDIPFTLYKWQEEEVKLWGDALLQGDVDGVPETPRRFTRVKTRGIGLTWLVAGYCVWAAGMRGKRVVIGSRTEDMAMDVLERCGYIRRSVLSTFPMAVSKESTKKMEFANRGGIYSETAGENMGSGYHPSVFILDEWAKLDNDWRIMSSVMPAVGDIGVFIGFSSPVGYGNSFQVFYDGAVNNQNGFNAKRLHWQDLGENDPRWAAVFNQGWYERQCRGLNNDPSMIAQELDCDFVQSGSPVFRQTDIDMVFNWHGKSTWPDLPRQPIKGEAVIVAIDPASGEAKGSADFTAICVLDANRCQIHAEKWQKPIAEAQRRLYEIMSWYTKPIAVIERNGLGLLYSQMLRGGARDGLWRLVEVHTLMGSQEIPPDVGAARGKDAIKTMQKFWHEVGQATMVYLLQRDIERRSLRLYHEGTRSELLIYARAGPDRFAVAQGAHDDQVQALLLAYWAVCKGWIRPDIEPVKRGRSQAPRGESELFDLERGD
jgi:hypothetical protein